MKDGSPLLANVENGKENASPSGRHIESFDVLKAGLTLLVVLHHTAITYGARGGWFYHEVQASASLQSIVLTYFCAVNQAYFMGFFFLLAGYFTPGALKRKGAVLFIRERLIRLGIPLVTFGFFLGPLTLAIGTAGQRANFFESLLVQWRHGAFILGPLWFVETLLLFSFFFVIFHFAARWKPGRSGQSPRVKVGIGFPTAAAMLAAAVVTGILSFLVRLYIPIGNETWGLQLAYFPGYIVLFLAGCLASKGHRLEDIPEDRARPLRVVSWITLPMLLTLFPLTHNFPLFAGNPTGGWNIPSFLLAMWESLVALGIIVALLQYFQRRFSAASPFLRKLSRRAYCIYVIHPVILVSISIALQGVVIAPLIKFAMVGSIACLASYVAAGLTLRLTVLQRIV